MAFFSSFYAGAIYLITMAFKICCVPKLTRQQLEEILQMIPPSPTHGFTQEASTSTSSVSTEITIARDIQNIIIELADALHRCTEPNNSIPKTSNASTETDNIIEGTTRQHGNEQMDIANGWNNSGAASTPMYPRNSSPNNHTMLSPASSSTPAIITYTPNSSFNSHESPNSQNPSSSQNVNMDLIYFIFGHSSETHYYRECGDLIRNETVARGLSDIIKELTNQKSIQLRANHKYLKRAISNFGLTFNGFTTTATSATTSMRIGRRSIALPAYYRNQWGIELRYSYLPAVRTLGGLIRPLFSETHESYFPMELLEVCYCDNEAFFRVRRWWNTAFSAWKDQQRKATNRTPEPHIYNNRKRSSESSNKESLAKRITPNPGSNTQCYSSQNIISRPKQRRNRNYFGSRLFPQQTYQSSTKVHEPSREFLQNRKQECAPKTKGGFGASTSQSNNNAHVHHGGGFSPDVATGNWDTPSPTPTNTLAQTDWDLQPSGWDS